MKKALLSAMFLGMAAFAFAQEPTVLFEEDFEWLAPWAEVGNYDPSKPDETGPCGSTVETDNPSANAPQLATPKVDGVSAYDALLAKGYEFLATCASSKKAREAAKQTYLQTNYLKFGLTGYYSGVVLPKFNTPANSTVTIAFDWCSMRQGSGTWDPTELVVIVANGEDEKQFLVPTYFFEENAEYKWIPTSVELAGATFGADTRIVIRNIDAQFPVIDAAPALRWFLDNIKVTAVAGGAAVNEVAVENNAPAEYFNILGVRVENPTNGLYIVRKGNKVSKVIVK